MEILNNVFSKLSNHMLEGMMFHDSMYKFYLFLGLYSFAGEQKKHYEEESKSYQALHKWFIKHENMLIKEDNPIISSTIPIEWYGKNRFDESTKDIQSGVIFGFNAWANWEKDTKELYSKTYKDLLDNGFIDEASYVSGLVNDVSKELIEAETKLLHLQAIDFDVIEIMGMN